MGGILQYIGWVAMPLSLFGTYLNAKKRITCWAVWTVSNLLWVANAFFRNSDIPQGILFLIFCAFNVYGFMQWRKEAGHVADANP